MAFFQSPFQGVGSLLPTAPAAPPTPTPAQAVLDAPTLQDYDSARLEAEYSTLVARSKAREEELEALRKQHEGALASASEANQGVRAQFEELLHLGKDGSRPAERKVDLSRAHLLSPATRKRSRRAVVEMEEEMRAGMAAYEGALVAAVAEECTLRRRLEGDVSAVRQRSAEEVAEAVGRLTSSSCSLPPPPPACASPLVSPESSVLAEMKTQMAVLDARAGSLPPHERSVAFAFVSQLLRVIQCVETLDGLARRGEQQWRRQQKRRQYTHDLQRWMQLRSGRGDNTGCSGASAYDSLLESYQRQDVDGAAACTATLSAETERLQRRLHDYANADLGGGNGSANASGQRRDALAALLAACHGSELLAADLNGANERLGRGLLCLRRFLLEENTATKVDVENAAFLHSRSYQGRRRPEGEKGSGDKNSELEEACVAAGRRLRLVSELEAEVEQLTQKQRTLADALQAAQQQEKQETAGTTDLTSTLSASQDSNGGDGLLGHLSASGGLSAHAGGTPPPDDDSVFRTPQERCLATFWRCMRRLQEACLRGLWQLNTVLGRQALAGALLVEVVLLRADVDDEVLQGVLAGLPTEAEVAQCAQDVAACADKMRQIVRAADFATSLATAAADTAAAGTASQASQASAASVTVPNAQQTELGEERGRVWRRLNEVLADALGLSMEQLDSLLVSGEPPAETDATTTRGATPAAGQDEEEESRSQDSDSAAILEDVLHDALQAELSNAKSDYAELARRATSTFSACASVAAGRKRWLTEHVLSKEPQWQQARRLYVENVELEEKVEEVCGGQGGPQEEEEGGGDAASSGARLAEVRRQLEEARREEEEERRRGAALEARIAELRAANSHLRTITNSS